MMEGGIHSDLLSTVLWAAALVPFGSHFLAGQEARMDV